MGNLSVKSMLQGAMFLVAVSIASMSFCIEHYNVASELGGQANATRYASLLLANELRQSSDDLTRLARTYAVSGDPKWEQQYFEVLDIRNGKKPRPNGYEKIYWDFRAADIDPGRGLGGSVPLIDRMKALGFSDEEFAQLKMAQDNSNDLVQTETIAMNLVKGLHQDAQGGFTIQGEPDLARARALMHDTNYHLFKAKIMRPLDEFSTLLDHRTQTAIDSANALKQRWLLTIVALGLLIFAGMAALMLLLYRQIVLPLQTTRDFATQISVGDLSAEAQMRGASEIFAVRNALTEIRKYLLKVISDVRRGAETVAHASSEIAQGNQDLSTRTENQARALEETAASVEELNAQVKHNADNARQAKQLASSASAVALRGREVVGRVVQTMKEINDSSQKIGDIISVIDGIAFQTNILALNAAVEAARAGEQGRGFAVVASEVRSLAGSSAEAAKEIKALIHASVGRVAHGSALVGEAGTTMTEVVDAIGRVSDLVGHISSASNEQASGVAQVGNAVTQLDQTTQKNAALVEQMAAAAGSMQSQASALVHAVAVFKLEPNYK